VADARREHADANLARARFVQGQVLDDKWRSGAVDDGSADRDLLLDAIVVRSTGCAPPFRARTLP
jgi:hypothetical protein